MILNFIDSFIFTLKLSMTSNISKSHTDKTLELTPLVLSINCHVEQMTMYFSY